MFHPFPYAFLSWFAAVAFGLILVAGAVWLTVPGWIASWIIRRELEDRRLKIEESYRGALAQVIGFPLALLGAFGLYTTVMQALQSYDQARRAGEEEQYRHGFDSLAASNTATRIGGLYMLQGLLSPGEGDDDGKRNGERSVTLLRAIAAFAVQQPGRTGDAILPPDALTALQILAFRSVQPNVGFDLRMGKFPGAVLADGYNARYADFRKFDFNHADLSGSDLYDSQFYEANLRFADLNGSNLAGAVLTRAGLSNATFCPGLNSAAAAMGHSYAVRTEMASSQFRSSFGENVRFDGAWLEGSQFNDSSFSETSFAGAMLESAQFDNAMLVNPDFTGADLKGATFNDATISHPTLTNAVLIDNDLHTAKGITEDDLVGALLCNVIGPTGKKLSGNCEKAAQGRIKRGDRPPSIIDCNQTPINR